MSLPGMARRCSWSMGEILQPTKSFDCTTCMRQHGYSRVGPSKTLVHCGSAWRQIPVNGCGSWTDDPTNLAGWPDIPDYSDRIALKCDQCKCAIIVTNPEEMEAAKNRECEFCGNVGFNRRKNEKIKECSIHGL